MVDTDGIIERELFDDFGSEWTFGRSYRDGSPNWWMATRKRHLTNREMERGLCPSLVEDTAGDLRKKLVEQTDLQVRVAASAPPAPAPESARAAAWNPAYL